MNRLTSVRLFDPRMMPADDESQTVTVFWVSRHQLLPTQEEVLYYLHDRDVRIYDWGTVFFSGVDVARTIANLSRKGTVYGVFPRVFFDHIKCGVGVPDLRFRTFYGTVQTNDYSFSCVEEVVVSRGVQKRSVVFNNNNLAYLKSRCVSWSFAPLVGLSASGVSFLSIKPVLNYFCFFVRMFMFKRD